MRRTHRDACIGSALSIAVRVFRARWLRASLLRIYRPLDKSDARYWELGSGDYIEKKDIKVVYSDFSRPKLAKIGGMSVFSVKKKRNRWVYPGLWVHSGAGWGSGMKSPRGKPAS